MPDDDGQDAFDTPNRESPTPSQNDDMEQNFSRGGADDNPPERDSVEIRHDGQARGFERMREQTHDDED
jgi:hypothetical protein